MFTKRLLFFLGCFVFKTVFSQTPEDALRASWFIPGGSARSTAIGGTMGSLGGDIASVYTNPAGLGMYKTSEFVITPGFLFNDNKAEYRNTTSSGINKSAFQLGTLGIVSGRLKSNTTSGAFSITFNQLASYNNRISYSGYNNYSSYSEQYLEELTSNNADVNAASNNFPFTSSLAFFTFLVDTIANAQGEVTGYQSLVPVSTGINQVYDEVDKGGLYEASFSFASNNADKLYLGASINVPLSFYSQDINYSETDASNDPDNNFAYSQLHQYHSLNGAGLNARLGIIYRLDNSLRLGLAFHTPSIMSYTDNLSAEMTTNTEGYAGVQTAKSTDFPNASSETQYNEITPYHIVASAAYLFSEAEDIKMQKGFITADVEYINYRGSRFYQQSDDGSGGSSSDYYSALNDAIKSYYKGALNIRLGGEIKFAPFAFRLGAGYYGSPYQDKALKANRILAATGFGYRNHGFFVDLTFAENFNKDYNFPYRLSDTANTYAQLKNMRSNVILSLGVKL